MLWRIARLYFRDIRAQYRAIGLGGARRKKPRYGWRSLMDVTRYVHERDRPDYLPLRTPSRGVNSVSPLQQ